MSVFLKNDKVNKNVLGYLETAHLTGGNGLLFPGWCLEFAEQTVYWSTPFSLFHVTAHAGTPFLLTLDLIPVSFQDSALVWSS